MANAYTEISDSLMHEMVDSNLSPQQVIQHLYDSVTVRSFAEVLRSMYRQDDLRERLIAGLSQDEPGRPAANISAAVDAWLKGTRAPDKRETFFQVAFALGLSEQNANTLLCQHVESGIHYRNPRELTLAYGLRAGMCYADALALFKGLALPPDSTTGSLQAKTALVRSRFLQVCTRAEFLDFYAEVLPELGVMHNTAYEECIKWLDLLQNPDHEVLSDYSLEYVTNTYLRMHMPAGVNTSSFDRVQKVVKRCWPNATQIKDIRARKKEVSRKLLLLLYLAAGGVTPDAGACEVDFQEDLDAAELLEEHVSRINSILDRCAMCLLDPRAPFDWLVLYCLKTEGDDAMDERMASLIDLLFPNPV